MLCNKCNNETLLDHTEEKDGKTVYFYACINPKCIEYRKAQTPMGVESDAQIKDS